jgi:hypothetical protein
VRSGDISPRPCSLPNRVDQGQLTRRILVISGNLDISGGVCSQSRLVSRLSRGKSGASRPQFLHPNPVPFGLLGQLERTLLGSELLGVRSLPRLLGEFLLMDQLSNQTALPRHCYQYPVS